MTRVPFPAVHAAPTKPVVLVPACNVHVDEQPVHFAGQKYVDAVRLAGAQPLIVPNAEPADLPALLELADGIFLTGSPSNVHPSHFGETVHDPSLPLDPRRDAWTLPLVRLALEHGVPLLAVCRGVQEMNVALGGSLHQAVQKLPGRRDHRSDPDDDVEVQYGRAHEVRVAPGGVLAQLLGSGAVLEVNSLHGQGVNRLADDTRIEAVAPDGLVEAISVDAAPAFNLGVQWHPEWRAADNPVSMRLLAAFGEACAARRDARRPTEAERDAVRLAHSARWSPPGTA